MLQLLSLLIQEVKITRLCGLLWKTKKNLLAQPASSQNYKRKETFFFSEISFLLPFCCLPKEAVDCDEVTPYPSLLHGEQTN